MWLTFLDIIFYAYICGAGFFLVILIGHSIQKYTKFSNKDYLVVGLILSVVMSVFWPILVASWIHKEFDNG